MVDSIKEEVLDTFEFGKEKYEYINDVKKEPYFYNNVKEPMSSVINVQTSHYNTHFKVAVVKMEQQVDFTQKNNKLSFYSTYQKWTDNKTYIGDIHFSQTEYNNHLELKPTKVVIIQIDPNENKPNICKICNKTFYSKTMFYHHQSNVNCGRKPYPCHLCERSYSERNILSMHQTIVHGHGLIEPKYCFKKIQSINTENKNVIQ